MGDITFSGLASGLDSASIIDKLVSLEKAPATALASRRASAQKRITALSDLGTKLRSLRTSAQAVDTSSELRGLATTATGSELTVTGSSTAQPGRWTVSVSQLARAETDRSRVLASRDAGALGDGSIAIAVGGAAAVTVSYGAADSLDAVAARINDQVAGVTASVLDTGSGFRLIIASDETGVANALTFTESGDALGMTEAESARDAIMTVAGTQITRASNDVEGAIPGVTLHLTAVTAAGSDGAVVTVARDPAAQKTAVQALLDAHNAVAKILQGQLSYSGTKKGEDSLFGDSALQGLQRRLAMVWTTSRPSGAGTVSARDLGITLGTDGALTLDAKKLEALAASSPEKLEHLLAGEDGLAAKLAALADEMTRSGTGVLAAKESSLRQRTKSFDEQIAKIEDAADALGERLRLQFSRLEQAVSGMQSNLTYLSSLLT